MRRRSSSKLLPALLVSLLCVTASMAATTLPVSAATGSHTGSAPAVHMQIKDDAGAVVCFKYSTPETTAPVASGCPEGSFREQLFDDGWSQIGSTLDITIGTDTAPEDTGEATVRNPNPEFRQFEDKTSLELDDHFNDLTTLVEDPDNYDGGGGADNGGRAGDGNFRISCQYSHYEYADPIVFPGQPGAGHLHMFFGKTNADAYTTKDNVAESGGGTCNGFELNRSAYWTPALLNQDGKAVVPKTIFVYYKSTRVPEFGVARMKQGLKLIGGNVPGSDITPSADSYDVFWSCGPNGSPRKDETKSGEIPTTCGDDVINATIYFPQCSNGQLDSADHLSHAVRLESVTDACPATHPIRLPEIGILLYYPAQASTAGWRLSSDPEGTSTPGSTLHADWMGGWHDPTMDLWVQECNRAQRNCTFGQTSTPRQLKRIRSADNSDDWLGPYLVTPPQG